LARGNVTEELKIWETVHQKTLALKRQERRENIQSRDVRRNM